MKKLILFLSIISFHFFSYAKDLSEINVNHALCSHQGPLTQTEKDLTKTCVKALEKQNLPLDVDTTFSAKKIIPILMNCGIGIKNNIYDQFSYYKDFFVLFFKNGPDFVYENFKKFFEENPITTIADFSDYNAEKIEKIRKLAEKYWKFTGELYKKLSTMFQNEFQYFFCYPPEVQSQVLCYLAAEIYMVFWGPDPVSFLLTGDWTQALGKIIHSSLKKSLNVVINGEVLGRAAYGLNIISELSVESDYAYTAYVDVKDFNTMTDATIDGLKKNESELLITFNLSPLFYADFFPKRMIAINDYYLALFQIIKKNFRGKTIEVIRDNAGGLYFKISIIDPSDKKEIKNKISSAILSSVEIQNLLSESAQFIHKEKDNAIKTKNQRALNRTKHWEDQLVNIKKIGINYQIK